eukprot:240649-Amorphochlora_amoeboformis.AAC.2
MQQRCMFRSVCAGQDYSKWGRNSVIFGARKDVRKWLKGGCVSVDKAKTQSGFGAFLQGKTVYDLLGEKKR